jgi:hypothetical protein
MPNYTYSQIEVEAIAQHAAVEGFSTGYRGRARGQTILECDLPAMRAAVLARLKKDGLIMDTTPAEPGKEG